MALQVEILANPSSGRGRGPDRAKRIAELLSARGHNVGLHNGLSGDDATAWAGDASRIADRLLVVGGDGTLNAVLNGLPADSPPIVLSPFGTANLVAHGLTLNPRPESAAALIEGGRLQKVDLATATYINVDGARMTRRCLMCVGFGFDGELMRRFDDARNGPVHKAQYLKHLGETLTQWTPVPQTVIADGEELGEFVYGILVGFGYYGLTQLNLGPSELADGHWELTLFKDLVLLRTGVAAVAAAGGQLSRLPGVVRRRVRAVQVQAASPSPLQLDGDYRGNTPLEFELDGTLVPFLVSP